MDPRTFEVEIRIKGRFVVEAVKVEEICKQSFSDEEGLTEEFLASAYGIEFQSAVLDALMSRKELLADLLLSHATSIVNNLTGNTDYLGLYQRIAKTMPATHKKLFQELLDSDSEIELMLPVLWSFGNRESDFGCIAVEEPFSIRMASVTECLDGKTVKLVEQSSDRRVNKVPASTIPASDGDIHE